jgi:glycosyltransferase involved in cell wall biosynthesis
LSGADGQSSAPGADPAVPVAAPAERTVVVHLQFAGDYLAALRTIQETGHETYGSQREALALTARMSRDATELVLICIHTATAYDERLDNGVRAIGLGLQSGRGVMKTLRMLDAIRPTHLVLAVPEWKYVLWARMRGVSVLPFLADSFGGVRMQKGGFRQGTRRLRQMTRERIFARLLNGPNVPWVANHNVAASKDLVGIGVRPEKVIPWDWPPQGAATDFEPKSLRARGPFSLLFVGIMVPSKGAGDAIAAVALLRKRGLDVVLTMFGDGELDRHRELARREGVEPYVRILGRRPHAEVIEQLKAADVALVPSWHDYPEGLPLTIYEAAMTRTPLVCSDHPMFQAKVSGRAVIHRERDVAGMAEQIAALLADPARYRALSEGSAELFASLSVPVRPEHLWAAWFHGSPDVVQLLSEQSIAARAEREARAQPPG